MNSTFIFIFAVLISSSGFNEALAKNVTNEVNAILSSIQNEHVDASKRSRIIFDDLCDDVLYEIMNLSEMEAVVNLCEAAPWLYPLAVLNYQMKYNNFEVKISLAKPVMIPGLDFKKELNPPRLNFGSYDTILNIIKRFGSAIQRIYIEHEWIESTDATQNIIQCIANYTSDSLTHLNLGIIKPNTLAQLPMTFGHIESVAFATKRGIILGETPPLNQLFPNLRQLEMDLLAEIDYNFIDVEFPKLEHLYMVLDRDGRYRTNQIISMIEKNPQIKSIGCENCERDYFDAIYRILPNITNLTLGKYDSNENTVIFENVKNFYYKVSQDGAFQAAIERLSFPVLESFKIRNNNFRCHLVEQFDGFFSRHRNISNLHYIDRTSNCNELMDLTKALPNLVEMTIECSGGTDHVKIINFVKSHEQLMRFQVTSSFGDAEMTNLRNFISKEWHIKEFRGEWRGFSFEKDQPCLH